MLVIQICINLSFSLSQSKDGRLTVFACDFFLMTPSILGAVDAVYDRGALEAITPQDRQSYVAVMKNLLSPEFRLVLIHSVTVQLTINSLGTFKQFNNLLTISFSK